MFQRAADLAVPRACRVQIARYEHRSPDLIDNMKKSDTSITSATKRSTTKAVNSLSPMLIPMGTLELGLLPKISHLAYSLAITG